MMKIILTILALSLLCSCISQPEAQSPISITIERPDSLNAKNFYTNGYGELVPYDENNGSKYFPVDFIVKIKNDSDSTIELYNEWCSWGCYNLVFYIHTSDFSECWITKKDGIWYRNFPSAESLSPGKSLIIPVAFNDNIWKDLDKIRKSKDFIDIQAVYHQDGGKSEFSSFFKHMNLWDGIIKSKSYAASELLPSWGLKSSKKEIKEKDELIIK